MNGARSASRLPDLPHRDKESPSIEAAHQIPKVLTKQRSGPGQHTPPRTTLDTSHPAYATEDTHDHEEPYEPDWEYFGFTKDGPPPLPDDNATDPDEILPTIPEEPDNAAEPDRDFFEDIDSNNHDPDDYLSDSPDEDTSPFSPRGSQP